MSVRIRKNGRILCSALNKEEIGDIYVDDSVHYQLSVIDKILITTKNEHHMKNDGEWWWIGTVPKNIIIDNFYKNERKM